MVVGEKNRLDHFDVVKGMAIIALVASHAYWYYPVKIFTKFYMALFVFCSGYFIRPERSLKELIYKRWKGLYVPFVCFCTLFLITHNGLSKLGITFPEKDWMEIGRDFLGILTINNREYLLIQVWFVTMLMLIEFCYILLYKIFFLYSKDKKMVNLMCLACGGGILCCKYHVSEYVVKQNMVFLVHYNRMLLFIFFSIASCRFVEIYEV